MVTVFGARRGLTPTSLRLSTPSSLRGKRVVYFRTTDLTTFKMLSNLETRIKGIPPSARRRPGESTARLPNPPHATHFQI
ncbi:MAG: hypothetical protein JWQ34_2027 [Mucilaginibacter sp.]|nr:hypothetical protein [Mucilaginibacter sp.]